MWGVDKARRLGYARAPLRAVLECRTPSGEPFALTIQQWETSACTWVLPK